MWMIGEKHKSFCFCANLSFACVGRGCRKKNSKACAIEITATANQNRNNACDGNVDGGPNHELSVPGARSEERTDWTERVERSNHAWSS